MNQNKIAFEDAGAFRSAVVRELARKHPELCDESGIGFWPVPALIPAILAKCLHLLQYEISLLSVAGRTLEASMLTQVRLKFMKLVFQGDLGEDHAGLYLKDHPRVNGIVNVTVLPLSNAYFTALDQDDAFILMGFIFRAEVGSLEAVKALVDTKLISNGRFAKIHLVEEIAHAELSEEIRETLLGSNYASPFKYGCALHDRLNREAAGLA